jgi:CHAT domain-containing protein
MKKTLYLTVSLHQDQLKLSCHDDDETRWKFEYTKISMDKVNHHCSMMADCLNRLFKEQSNNREAIEEIKQMGRTLYDQLLGASCKAKLSESDDALYLIIQLDERLVNIPWELLYDDKGFLSQRFCMGRIVETCAPIEKVRLRKLTCNTQNMLIISDPDGDLDSAAKEGLALFKTANQMNRKNKSINPALLSEVSAERVLKRLKDYEIVHFAGHVDFHHDQSDQSALRLTHSFLKASDIKKLAGGAEMSSLVFTNACQSARPENGNKDDFKQSGAFGLANAFLFSGVRHYVGSLWNIFDIPGNHFALAFYQSLFSGETIGQSMKNARLKLIHEYGESFIAWSSHILYGDPRTIYFSQENAHQKHNDRAPITKKGKFRIWMQPSGMDSMIAHKWKWGFISLALICMLCWGLYFSLSSIQNSFCNKDFSDANQIKVYQTLIKAIEQKQRHTEQLVKDIQQKFPNAFYSIPASTDNWTSAEVPIAMIYEPTLKDMNFGNAILFGIQSQLLASKGCISLLERKSLDVILSEHIRANTSPEILLPELTIFLEIFQDNPNLYVLMRSVNKAGKLVDTIFETIEPENIIAQGKKITRQLAINLSKAYPVRGVITGISDDQKQFTLNIGENVHVDIDDCFQVLMRGNVHLKIIAVEYAKSSAMMLSGYKIPEMNMKVVRVVYRPCLQF